MNLEINKELVLSTAHISGKENASLNALPPELKIGTEANIYGWRIWVQTYGSFLTINKRDGRFSALTRLLALAAENDCKWLVLDRDGQTCNFLEQFDW